MTTKGMSDDEYAQHLYDRAARRLGYASFAEQSAETDVAVHRNRTKEQATADADMQAWAKAQLDDSDH